MKINQNIYLVVGAVQYFFVVLAFVLSAALVGKANSVSGEFEEEGNFYEYRAEYAFGVPSWMIFDLFAGIFGLLSLGGLFFAKQTGRLPPVVAVIIVFVNWIFFLSAFAATANAVSAYSLFCDIAFGDVSTAYCTLPRAVLGIDVITWLLLFAMLGLSVLGLLDGNPIGMGQRNAPPQGPESYDGDLYMSGQR